MFNNEGNTKRKQIDIRTLPGRWQWVIVLTVIGAISLVAWLVGREDPPTEAINWIMNNLPILGVITLLLIAFGIYQAWQNRK